MAYIHIHSLSLSLAYFSLFLERHSITWKTITSASKKVKKIYCAGAMSGTGLDRRCFTEITRAPTAQINVLFVYIPIFIPFLNWLGMVDEKRKKNLDIQGTWLSSHAFFQVLPTDSWKWVENKMVQEEHIFLRMHFWYLLREAHSTYFFVLYELLI